MVYGKYSPGNVDYLSKGQKRNYVEIEWRIEDDCFYAYAQIWNEEKSDVLSCGQIPDEILSFFPHDELIQRIVGVWKEWHLNDRTLGSPKQMAYLRSIGKNFDYPTARALLKEAKLDPDPDFLFNNKAYEYGSAQLYRPLPSEVVAEVLNWSEVCRSSANS